MEKSKAGTALPPNTDLFPLPVFHHARLLSGYNSFLMKCLIGLLLPLWIAACTPAPPPPDTLVIAVETGPATLDPRIATDAASVNVCRLIYAPLFRRDAQMRLVPQLAEKLEMKDPLTYVITLRRGLRFHTGAPLTAEDARYSLLSIVDEKSASPMKTSLGEVADVETPDPLTLVVRLKKPFAPFEAGLTFGIVPHGAGKELARNPVGAGPFRFVSYEPGDRLTLARNPDYMYGAPRLAGIVLKIVPDETVRLLELKKHNVHLVMNPITPAVLPWLGAQNGLVVKDGAGVNVSYLGFNMRDPALKNPLVRRAIAHAIDRRAIAARLLKGLADPTETLIAPPNPYHAEGLSQYPYSPETARRLLDEAGYPDPGGGRPRLTLTFKTSKNPTRRTQAEVFAENLARAGIALQIKSMEWGAFFSDIKGGNFQMYSLTWVGIADPDILHFIFHSSSIPPAGANRGGYANPALDRLLEEGRSASDEMARKRIYGEVQRLLAEELPFVTLWTGRNVAAMDVRLKGFVIYPDESLDSLATAWLEKGE